MSAISATTRRIGRIAAFETLYVLFLLGSLLVQAVDASVGSEAKRPHGAVEFDDNEFAEFEEFDEDSTEDIHPPDRGKNSAPPETETAPDDDDVGVFEDEDEQNKPSTSRVAEDVVEEDFEEETEGVVEEDTEDEFSHLQDEEEFENFDKAKLGADQKRPDGEKQNSQQLRFADVPAHLRSNWSNYQVEMLMMFGLTIYLLNYIYGKTKNQTIAQAWFDENRELLQQQFHIVGDDGTSQELQEGVMVKETDSTYSIWCSGRQGCSGMLVQLKMLKRQDIVSVMQYLMRPKYDRVVIRVDLDATEMDTFVFAVGQKKSLVKLAKDMMDLSQYCAEKKAAEKLGIPSNCTVLSEIWEASTTLLDNKVVAILNKYEECVDFIHVSDQYSGARPQEGETQSKLPETSKVLMFSFNIPGRMTANERQVEYVKPLTGLVFYLMDKVRRLKLTRESKLKAEHNRQAVEKTFLKMTHQQRQEAAQLRKEEKIKEAKERIMAEEDPDKQRRMEKAEQKREAKRNQPKMKQLKIKAM